MAISPDDREKQHTLARLAVIENALALILKRLGAPDEALREWRQATRQPQADYIYLYRAMNEILHRLRPPPRS